LTISFTIILFIYISFIDLSYLSIQSGPNELTEEAQGVNYRALGDLFLLSEQRKDTICYDIYVQMLEIYNEQVKDLLVTDGVHKRYPL
jgi:kinesin family protein C2/C3